MTDKSKNALDFASLGWRLFPAIWTTSPGKTKPSHTGLIKWGTEASDNPDDIRAWSIRWPGAYFCVAAHLSDITILDIDNKNGKNGSQALAELESLNEHLPLTTKSETPSGGYHLYFAGASAITSQRVGSGIDTPVMAPIPGSIVPGKGEYKTIKKIRPAPLPMWLSKKLGEKKERVTDHKEPVSELDTEFNIKHVADYLKYQAPLAMLGDSGNDTTYRVACIVRDKGVTEQTAVQLMLEHWYPRCDPNDKPEFIQRLVKNAYNYALNHPGAATPEALFPNPLKSTKNIKCAADITLGDIKPRQWLLGYRYILGYVTVTIAPGGVGKSIFTILEALSIASGKQITYDTVRQRGPVWIYNTEDPFEELDRRVMAAAKYHKLTRSDLADVYYTSGYTAPLRLVDDIGNGPVVMEHVVTSIIKQIKQRGILLLIVDPFIRCHGCNENDNRAIDLVVQQFTRIAGETGCAVSIVHHTRKTKSNSNSGYGDMDSARGASSLIAAARIAHTLYGMSDTDAKNHGIPKANKYWYIRLDDAKANLSPPCGDTLWFEKKSVSLIENNHDSVGTLDCVELNEVMTNDIDSVVRDHVMGSVQPGEMKSAYALAHDLHSVGLVDGSVKTLQSKIEKIFSSGVKTSYGLYKLIDAIGGSGKATKVVKCDEMFD